MWRELRDSDEWVKGEDWMRWCMLDGVYYCT